MAHTILIVDDDPTLIEMLTFVLNRAGYDAVPARGGAQALEVLRSTPVDLVVLDVMLPDIDGFEVCRRIRALPDIGKIPILMLSARSRIGHKLSGFESGADDYVAKPADPKEIIARIGALLSRSSQAHRALAPVVAMVGVKGGAGTTTTAVNVGVVLAAAHERTVLVEVSRGVRSGAWQLGLDPEKSLFEVTRDPGSPSTASALQATIGGHRSGLHYLATTPKEFAPDVLRSGVLGETLTLLRSLYDLVLVDLSTSGLGMWEEALLRASAVVLVTGLDAPRAQHLETVLGWIDRIGLRSLVRGIARVDLFPETTQSQRASIGDHAGLEVLGVIPYVPSCVQAALAARVPVAWSHPNGDLARAYERLAASLHAVPVANLNGPT